MTAAPVDGLVSTIVPVHNRPDLLPEAVRSVLLQTHRPIEIVIVDDGSTDATPRVCEALHGQAPDLVRIVRIAHSGPGAAREAGRRVIRGEFVQYLDSDDLIHPTKFERQVVLLRTTGADIAYCKTRQYAIGDVPSDEPVAFTGIPLDFLFPALLSSRVWYTPSPLFSRRIIDAIGPWTTLVQEEDWEYDARAGALGARLAWCPEFLADVRHHRGERAGGGSLDEPGRMRSRSQAHRLIYVHARRAGIGSDSPHMQRYARELFLLARQCGMMSLVDEATMLFTLSRAAAGPARSQGLDYRLYERFARIAGWPAAGRIAGWLDRVRAARSR